MPASDVSVAEKKENSSSPEQSPGYKIDPLKKRREGNAIDCPETPKKKVGWFGTDARAWCKGEGSPAKGQPWL